MKGSAVVKLEIFDSTLRDGAQSEGVSFSVQDKLDIVSALDEFGVAYIEAGNPGSNPKDIEFFPESAASLNTAKLCAFGARTKGIPVSATPTWVPAHRGTRPPSPSAQFLDLHALGSSGSASRRTLTWCRDLRLLQEAGIGSSLTPNTTSTAAAQ